MHLTLAPLLNLKRIPFCDVLPLRFVWLRACIIGSIFIIFAPWSTRDLLAAEVTIQAQSCAFSSVQAAVQTAKSSGTNSLITIPSGTCDWGANMLTIPGGISLKGAGKTSTVLRSTSATNIRLITIDCTNGKTSRVSDMTLMGKGDATIWDGGLAFFYGCTDFMVFNSVFRDFGYYGVNVVGDARGVIFQNDFLNNYRTGSQPGYGVVVYGNGTWPPLELGTVNAVFVENNYFSGNRHNIASNNGSRYVFRYNTVIGVDLTRDYPLVDAHGLTSSPRGSRSWEVYYNTVTTKLVSTSYIRSVFNIRGGDGVVFNNTVTNPVTVPTMIELTLDTVSAYPAKDQMTSGYFWNNTLGTVLNHVPSNFVEGRDYFRYVRPGYIPYTYPHPLRSTQAGTPPGAPSNLRVQ